MLSIVDCLDYCDLCEDEIAAIAEHEHLPYGSAAQLAYCLAATPEGTEVLRSLLVTAVYDAETCGHPEVLRVAQSAYRHFNSAHPTA